MSVQNPYEAPRQLAQGDDDARFVRKSRQLGRAFVFISAFVVLVLGAMLGFGGFAGIIIAAIGSTALAGIYNATNKLSVKPGLNPATTAGLVACTSCESMQTDQRYVAGPDGSQLLEWHCFSCSHSWAV